MLDPSVSRSEFLCEEVVVLIKKGGVWTKSEINQIKMFLAGRYEWWIGIPAAYWDEGDTIVIDYATNNPERRDLSRLLLDRLPHVKFSLRFTPEENNRSFLRAKKICG